jgi:hypothetical protein
LIEVDFEHRVALYKVGSLVMANRILMTLSKQRISHIFNSSKPRQKSLHVEVEYMLDNHILLCLYKLVELVAQLCQEYVSARWCPSVFRETLLIAAEHLSDSTALRLIA